LNYINNFLAEQALSKKIFFFKDLEESGLNVKKRATQIKDLLEITKAVSPLSQISEQKSTKENIGENLDNEKKNDIEIIDDLLTDEIKIYNTKKGKNISPNKNISKKEKGNEKKTILGKKGRKVKENEKIKISRNVKENSIDNNERGSNNYRGRDSRSSFNFIHNMNMKNQSKYQQNNNYNESKIETSEEDENTKGELSPDKITYDFNICEVIGSTICKCCQSKELKIKYNLNEKANSILYSKLDIVLYVRNMILFDIINETFLGMDVKDVINFLSRPIISLNRKEQNELAIFYHSYKSSDFDKFYDEINELSQKSNKRIEETQLISLTKKHLNSLVA